MKKFSMGEHRELIAAVAGYVIGATTAFIAFGIHMAAEPPALSENVNENRNERVDRAQGVSFDDVEIRKTSDGLFVEVDGQEKVVSVYTDAEAAPDPGFYVDLPYYDLAPNGEEVFLCSVMERGDEECVGLLYSIEKHSIAMEKTYSVNSIDHSW